MNLLTIQHNIYIIVSATVFTGLLHIIYSGLLKYDDHDDDIIIQPKITLASKLNKLLDDCEKHK